MFAQGLVLRPSFGGVISIGISQVPLNALASLHLPFLDAVYFLINRDSTDGKQAAFPLICEPKTQIS
jgi:hypothetical protein